MQADSAPITDDEDLAGLLFGWHLRSMSKLQEVAVVLGERVRIKTVRLTGSDTRMHASRGAIDRGPFKRVLSNGETVINRQALCGGLRRR